MNTAFRGVYNIYGYHFGEGEHAACIVGAMRGNEFQQMYICSLLSQKLALLEAEGEITADQSILLIPSLNYSAMNASRKHWLSDDTDINREFPGNRNGTATSRIAYTILERTKEYRYGIQFPSFYHQGRYIPHVRMMQTGHESRNLANLFGLPYVITSDIRSFDRTTLNYNWQMAGTDAFSIYSGGTERINRQDAEIAVSSVLRFLSRMGIIRYNCQGGYIEVMKETTGLTPYITDHLCPDDTGHAKASNIRAIVEKHNLKSPIYVGDTQGDLNASREAGVKFVFASYGFGQVDSYDGVIEKPEDLLTLSETEI